MGAAVTRAKPWLVGLLLLIGGGGSALALRSPAPTPLALEMPTVVPSVTVAPTATAAPLVVYVSGAVHAPGVYTLPPESRVVDALNAAGGPTEDAAVQSLNQATRLSDGMQVHMPAQGEAPAPPAPAPVTDAASPGESDSTLPVRLNHASAAELETLPGIGPTLAARIIEYRTANGPFATIEAVGEVKGIGDKVLEEIRPHLVLD